MRVVHLILIVASFFAFCLQASLLAAPDPAITDDAVNMVLSCHARVGDCSRAHL